MSQRERFTAEISTDEFIEKYFRGDEVLEKCRECPSFSKTWSCPAFDFDPIDYWRSFNTYKVICDRLFLCGADTPEEAEKILCREKSLFDGEMLALEKSSPGSAALYAAKCRLCSVCSRTLGLPCRLPDKMRYSVESLGGLGVSMVEDLFGFGVMWSEGSSVPPYYILLGGLLKV